MIFRVDKTNPTIFTTGAFLRPMKVKDTDGNDIYVWYVCEFVDDTFNNGVIYNPHEVAGNLETLVKAAHNKDD